MKLTAKIKAPPTLTAKVNEIRLPLDGGFEEGFEQGYEKGNEDGYAVGYAEGLSARKYETWAITLIDGTVVEKEVALL